VPRAFLGRLLRFLPLLVIVVAVNMILDPGQHFRTWRPGSFDYEREIASLTSNGQNVAGVWSYDERLVQRYVAETLHEPPSVLVLGSSRMLQMHRPVWLGSFQNASVSGGSMLDLMALYNLYAQRPGPAPKVVVFGVDPWMLGKEGPLEPYPLADAYRTARQALGLGSAPPAASTPPFGRAVEQLRILASPTYFQLALKYLVVTRGHRPFLRATRDTAAADPIRRSDGSITYDAPMRGRLQKAVDEEARAYASADPIYNLGFSRIDTEAAKELTALLRDAGQRGTCAVVVLMPYHPTVYHVLATSVRYSVPISVGSFVRQLARSVSAPVVGDYDPAAIGMTSKDFYDGMHVTEGISNQILSEALSRCSAVRPSN